MAYTCYKCGLQKAESICSANPALFICVGARPEAGCGKVLTPTERHYYGTCCETCTRRWDRRVQEWRDGADDKEMDDFFDDNPPINH